MFYVKAFFYLARAQFVCKRIQSEHHADAVQMQKIHNLCKQETEVGLTIITGPGKGKGFNRGKSIIERLMKRDQSKEKEPERSRMKEGPTARL